MTLPEQLAARCAGDPEFSLCARHWTGALHFDLDQELITLTLRDGVPSATATSDPAGVAHVTVSAPGPVWAEILQPVPPPYFNDVVPAQAFGLQITGDRETSWQYHAAIRRAVDLLRMVKNGSE